MQENPHIYKHLFQAHFIILHQHFFYNTLALFLQKRLEVGSEAFLPQWPKYIKY